MKREVPVFLFTGFLESGKTSFIKDTLEDKQFIGGDKVLLIVCEEGMEEYDELELARRKIYVERVEELEEITAEYLAKCEEIHKPDKVMIEYNGTWVIDPIIDEDNYPDIWILAQVISTVDATTYGMYWSNMRSMIVEQVKLADLVILNRCDANTKKNEFRRNIKMINSKAQIAYEAHPDFNGPLPDEGMPFDMDADIVDIGMEDYGIWFTDAMDNPKKYDGKVVRFQALVFKPPKYGSGIFVPGRFAMTCCADDMTYLGMLCKYADTDSLNDKDWVTVTAKVKREFVKEYRGKGPVLYATGIEKTPQPDDMLVYM